MNLVAIWSIQLRIRGDASDVGGVETWVGSGFLVFLWDSRVGLCGVICIIVCNMWSL